jgi:hypothetical protein
MTQTQKARLMEWVKQQLEAVQADEDRRLDKLTVARADGVLSNYWDKHASMLMYCAVACELYRTSLETLEKPEVTPSSLRRWLESMLLGRATGAGALLSLEQRRAELEVLATIISHMNDLEIKS